MSDYKIHERVKELATTSGTGTFTLANTVQTGFVRFSDIPGIADGNFVPYCAYDDTASPVAWEVGFGTYNLTAKTLARTGVLSNSLGTTAAINFANAPTIILSDNSAMARTGPYQLVPGRYYSLPSSIQTDVPSVKVLFTPFYIPNPIALQSLAVRLGGTVNSGTLCLGIASDVGGVPSTLLAQASQAIGSANANSSVVLSLSQFLVPGMYWVVSSFTSSVNATLFGAAAGGAAYGFNALSIYAGYTSATNALTGLNSLGYSSSDTPGTSLPTTFSGLSPNQGSFKPALVALGF